MWLKKRQLPLYLAIALAALVTVVLIVNGKPSHPPATVHSSPSFDVASALHFGHKYPAFPRWPPEPGWFTTANHVSRPKLPVAWATTKPWQRGEMKIDPRVPVRTLKRISDKDILISATFPTGIIHPSGPDNAFVAASFPPQLDGDYTQRETSEEGIDLPGALYRMDVYTRHEDLEIRVYFGTFHPGDRLLTKAQGQIDHLQIQPSAAALSYTGVPLPGPSPVRVGPEGLSMEVPPSWRGWVVPIGSQPPSFVATNFAPENPRLCAHNGPLETLPAQGVVLYVSALTSAATGFPPRPQHVVLDPRTYGPGEGTGCHPAYSVLFKLREFAISAQIFFGSDPPLLLKAQTLRALDSIRFVGG
ncbi:MAG: hypothetical protein ABR579_02795 [Actinomycetota bacterium]